LGDGATVTAANYNNLELKPSGASAQILGGGTFNVAGSLTVGNETNAGATAAANNPTIDVTDNFVISTNATFTSTSGNLSVGNDFDNNGTFIHNSGTVIFNNNLNNADITGTTTFNNVISTTANKNLYFESGTTFTLAGNLTINGGSGTPVTVQSSSSPTQWIIHLQGSATVNHARIKDSGCHGSSVTIDMNSSNGITNLGNNGTCWDFPAFLFGQGPSEGGASGGGTPTGGGGSQGGGGGSEGGGSGGGATLPETFTNTNGVALTTHNSNWTLLNGDFAINTNAVYSNTAATDTMAQWTAASFNNNQFSELTITAVTSGGYIGVAVRTQNGAQSGYGAYCDSSEINIIEWNAGTPTEHYSGSSCSVNDDLRLEISGTTITLKINNSTVTTVTDSTYSSGRPGLVGNNNSTGTRGDTWNAGSVSAGGGGGESP
jgi:hypothetical protein